MPFSTPQRSTWSGDPVREGELFRLHKTRCGGPLQATCELWTHRFGWELRLVGHDGQLQRSEVCRSADAVLQVSETWKMAMVERGWA
jgi:hypothetical protein